MKKKILTISILSILSILFWFSIALTNDFISIENIKIEFKDLPNSYSVSTELPEEITVTLKGSGWNLLKYKIFEKESFVVSLHKRIGKKKIELIDYVSSNNWLSSNFVILDISPSSIDLELEKTISKTVRVFPNIKLEFAEGYGEVSDIEIYPKFIEIKGAPTILKNIDSVFTVDKHFENIKENFNENIPLKTIQGIEFSADNCNISFEVQKIVTKNFEDVTVKVINSPKEEELILYPNKVNVILQGGINVLGKFTNDSLNVYVDFSSIKKEDVTVIPKIDLPNYVKLISLEPNNLEFVIKKN